MFLKMRNGLPRLFRCMSNECSEVKEMAAMIVRDYLSGHWKMANSNNVTVQKISGGLSNWLYQITLSSFQNQGESSDPKTVLIRFHGPIYGKSAFEHIVTDSLIFMLMSERSLGPKLHGVFPGGRIEEYIPARSLKTSELSNPKISSAISCKIAQVHSLNVPISKNAQALFDLMSKWMVELERDWKKYESNGNDHIQGLMDKFKSFDISSEVKWLRDYLTKLNSLVVFCHNDLQEGNILITYDSINSDEPNLVLIDYEYCSYNYRGFDFANHFLEYTINYKVRDYPYFKMDTSSYPSTEEQLKFVRNYLKVYKDLTDAGEGINDSVDVTEKKLKLDNMAGDMTEEEAELLNEISNFRLLSHLLWGIWAATHSQSDIEFGYWDYCIARLDAYFETKKEILLYEIPRVRKKSKNTE